ncbi:F-box protein At1g30790-like [Papaver somniferum]|uniref:F-box protein At1g30790-like n=1 Tax=Papaver somniferum TaxID=3469 RepID=UPI000E702F2C|nr:F-box protein At1g30790-like [Papaver somniferum]XP_026425689.1 F-box protein At1g30790-like [Papaver somniferum]XP_026425690.1 F-box protein At1g30790-like [Papaver somniferum]XP_026425691.1 F-box protein At1g30790-like [Papaver somniferum]XP_026425692.1 F-box protein At1g30790-like [Papaver somniferum]XP_026425693.1 F-box protein At1g30790-like [Papaver somniferum]XP_026425694.1 F-box protein At1g30790-like [Papaver somniferum]XP_026425695.1 F-box protein At1g30790-like [Papaver somnife
MMSKKKRTLRLNNKKRDKEIDADHAAAHLPEELVIENILTGLPVRTLAQWSCVSKLWYNSIFNDTRFAKAHFANSKNRKLNLFVDVLNVWARDKRKACFLSLENDFKYRSYMNVNLPETSEPVGYCNGLACITLVPKSAKDPASMIVINPSRGETLSLPYFQPNNGGCEYLCHGLGFDSLSEEYKVVIIFTSKDNTKFITMVCTLGTKSWRNLVTSVAEISPPPGCSPFPNRMVSKAWGNIRTPATLCGGNLFWRITNREVEEDEVIINNNQYEIHYNDKVGMLLSFDIHKEKIQFIRLPAECNLIPTPTTTAMINIVVEHHLLEYKGYPCVAVFEKTVDSGIHHGRHRRNTQTSFCCCRLTIQLCILKNKEKQVWIKGESFSVQVKELGLLPGPFCCYFDTTTATTASFPTRILSISDQVLLYSFDGECLKFYNFQTKHLEVVRSSSCDLRSRGIFEAKMKGSPSGNGIDDKDYKEDDMYCPYLDYQLHAQVENIHSLKTFIPAGETRTFDQFNDFIQFLVSKDNDFAAGWVDTLRKPVKIHAFF